MSYIYQETSPLNTRQVHVTSTIGMTECMSHISFLFHL